jgi:uncharacterized protein (TIGR02145 family)
MPTDDNCSSGTLVSVCPANAIPPAFNYCELPSSSSVSSPSGGSSSSYQALEGCPDASVSANAVSCGGKTYKTVKIGTQTWMAENLNYNASGSRCYGDNTGGDSQGNCTSYGRLYNWATAMGISSDYNSSSYNPSSSTRYRGVCPSGWHIPSNAEWDKLMRYVDGTNGTSSPYDSPTAGKHLKATSGWNSCSASGSSYSCLDTHGFSALPGGYGNSDGDFYNVGYYGDWWSATEDYSGIAYYRYMNYYNEYAYWYHDNKGFLFSVRCLQD